MLRRGVYVDDRDGLIDMILFYYVCKVGVGMNEWTRILLINMLCFYIVVYLLKL